MIAELRSIISWSVHEAEDGVDDGGPGMYTWIASSLQAAIGTVHIVVVTLAEIGYDS